MRFFKYHKIISTDLAYRIFNEVYSLRNYAGKIYHGLSDEALDASFHHIITHYDETKGSLENYVISTVNKILLNKNKYEVEMSDVDLEVANTKSTENFCEMSSSSDTTSDLACTSDDVSACVECLLPYFIMDYKFFKSKKSSDKKYTYSKVFEKFSSSTILESINILFSRYGEDVEYLYRLKRKCTLRNFSKSNFNNELDSCIEYVDTINDIVVYKKKSGRFKRFFYTIDVRTLIDAILKKFYTQSHVKVIGDITVYCSLSGQLLTSMESLLDQLESEVLGALLVRSRGDLKMVRYSMGELMVCSNKNFDTGFFLYLCGSAIYVPLGKMISKCVGITG